MYDLSCFQFTFCVNLFQDKSRLAILQLLEDRYGKKSILIASKIPVANWYDYIAYLTLADA